MKRNLRMDHVQFEVFSDLEFHDDDGTLVVHPPDTELAILRCSVTDIHQQGEEVLHVAEREIPRLAGEAGACHEVSGEKFLFHTSKPSQENSRDTVYHWHLGMGGHIALVTVFVDHRLQGDPRARHVLDCAALLLETFRRNSRSTLPAWQPFDYGNSLGQPGSEDGRILRDEEHPDGCRITLERNSRNAPFAITCGISGWMVHTRYNSTESAAISDFDSMKADLSRILSIIPLTSDPEARVKTDAVHDALSEFADKFP